MQKFWTGQEARPGCGIFIPRKAAQSDLPASPDVRELSHVLEDIEGPAKMFLYFSPQKNRPQRTRRITKEETLRVSS
jgi:hypothetical protein